MRPAQGHFLAHSPRFTAFQKKPKRQTRRMPIFGSDLPEYVTDPKHREALRELERIAPGTRQPLPRRLTRGPRNAGPADLAIRNDREPCD